MLQPILKNMCSLQCYIKSNITCFDQNKITDQLKNFEVSGPGTGLLEYWTKKILKSPIILIYEELTVQLFDSIPLKKGNLKEIQATILYSLSKNYSNIVFFQNYFILTSSMDKTVRLWHISRRECLCCFQHIDFVTAISFHPRNDQVLIQWSFTHL